MSKGDEPELNKSTKGWDFNLVFSSYGSISLYIRTLENQEILK